MPRYLLCSRGDSSGQRRPKEGHQRSGHSVSSLDSLAGRGRLCKVKTRGEALSWPQGKGGGVFLSD